MPSQNLSVPIPGDLIAEIILRSRGRADPVDMVHHALVTFLDRTRGDASIWSEEHADEVAEEDEFASGLNEYGNPTQGYHWQNVYLPNGTKLKIVYKGKDYYADVKHQQITYDGSSCSPSQFASRVTNNTSRNAWRDIWVKRPSDKVWQFAERLRLATKGS